MIIAILGEPATGKTTLMKEIIKELGPLKPSNKPFYHYSAPGLVLWGKYDEGTFQGTDKLSMGVQPLAVEFAMMARHKLILFEGDRIGNVSFFKAVAPYHEIKIYLLEVSEEEKARRHIARNDNQSEKFLKAKKTKLKNLSERVEIERCDAESFKGLAVVKDLILQEVERRRFF
jgi:dephospho-CoA kinase